MPVISCPDCGKDVSTIAASCPHCGRPSPAGTSPIAASSVKPLVEETLWKGSPSWKLLLGQIVTIVVTLLAVPLLGQFLASRMSDPMKAAQVVHYSWLVAAALVALELVLFLLALARLRSTVYTITNQRVMIEAGMLTRSLSEIDLRYIDDTQFFQGITDRLLGVGNITLISSDKTSPTYVLRGIPDPRNVRETIRANAYQVSQRQIFTRAT